MSKLNKSSYSIFEDINNIQTTKQKKALKLTVNNFIRCICEIYDIDSNSKIIIDNEEDVVNFIIKIGIIDKIEEIKTIKDILKNDYNRLVNALSQYLKLEIGINEELKKYMDYYRKTAVEEYNNNLSSNTLVDFFCGAGGMSLGFYQTGFKALLANDIEEVCTNTYSFNHYDVPRDKIITGDIRTIVDNIENYVKEEVDVIIGGPPCQGFSMANRQRVIDDERNILYRYYVKGVEKLKPKFFVMENVKGMLSVAEQVREDFHNLEEVDYDVAYTIFNAKDFGVPQNRERLIYIGIRADISKEIKRAPEDIIREINKHIADIPNYNLSNAIDDLRPLEALRIMNSTELDTEESGSKIERNRNIYKTEYKNLINMGNENLLTYNHKARYNNDRDIEIFGRMLPGDKSDSERIVDIMPYASRNDIFKDKYYKLISDRVCKTITAHMKFDCNMYIHPNQARGLTPREAARVQSYPDNYFFLGAYTKTYMQIGNSVPPLMSRGIANVLKRYLRR